MPTEPSIQNIESLEIGYSILPEYWYNGYASESVIKCKNYADFLLQS